MYNLDAHYLDHMQFFSFTDKLGGADGTLGSRREDGFKRRLKLRGQMWARGRTCMAFGRQSARAKQRERQQ